MGRNLKYPKFPTMGEVLRFVSLAFDLRGRADQTTRDRLDRAAREGEFDPQIMEELIHGLIVDPLARVGEARLGERVAHYLTPFFAGYAQFVTKVQADAMRRDQLMPLLTAHYFADCAAEFMILMAREYFLPDPHLLLAPPLGRADKEPERFLRTVIDLHLASRRQEGRSPVQLIHDQKSDPDHVIRDKIRRWLAGRQLPDLDGLFLLPSLDSGSSSSLKEGGPKDRALLRQLMVARALDFAFSRTPDRARLCDDVRRRLLPDASPIDIGLIVSSENIRVGAGYGRDLVEQGLRLISDLDFSQRRTAEQINDAEADLRSFSRLADRAEAPWATAWLLGWCHARLALWRGDWLRAMDLYESALRCVFYNAGRNVKYLTIEALYVACVIGKRPAIKRLLNPVTVLGIRIELLGQHPSLALTEPSEAAKLLRLRHLSGLPEDTQMQLA